MLNANEVEKKKAELKASQEESRKLAEAAALEKYLTQVEKVVLSSIDNFTTIYKPATVSAQAQKALEDAGYQVFDNGNTFLIKWKTVVEAQVFPCDDGCMCQLMAESLEALADENTTTPATVPTRRLLRARTRK